MPPKPWIKKNKNSISCRVMHIDALTVTVINDHKTARKQSSFAPFQAYHNTEVFSFRGLDQGLCPWTPLGAQPPDLHYRLCARHMGLYGSQPLLLDPPLLLVNWGGGHQSQCPTPQAPQFSRLRHRSSCPPSPCKPACPAQQVVRTQLTTAYVMHIVLVIFEMCIARVVFVVNMAILRYTIRHVSIYN